MATTWWDQAYAAIQKQPVQPNQQNQDWGAMKDAFLLSTAEKGLNYELTRALSAAATNDEKGLMQLSADLDRRNTLDLMAGEQKFKIEGLQAANDLSKDYLSAEGAQSRANIAAQGEQDRSLQYLQNTGAIDVAKQQRAAAENVANTKASSDMYGADRGLDAAKAQAFAEQYVSEQQRAGAENVASTQAGAARDVARTQADAQRDVTVTEGNTARDVANIQGGFGLQGIREQEAGETQRTGMNLASQERQIGLTGSEARLNIGKQGEESRKTIETEGEQSRLNIRTQGEEQRYSVRDEREHAAGLATRMSRRA